MNPERWQQIDGLFRVVSQAEPGRRAVLLAELTAGDEELRREVEALLEASEAAGGFLESNVFEAAAPLLAGKSHELQTGQGFDRYRIIKQIGAGGMGEVYSAEDPTLGRRVALKILPASFIADAERVRRFRQEARASSSLNHPNIVTVHEVGEAEGLYFIVTEYVEGRTLRELIEGSGLGIGRALEVAVQAASALAAAHEAGVVHRDIKPENMMVRADGYVKVLDFGLAKLTERAGTAGAASGETAQTLLKLSTQTGLVMGTTHYMSPEQARGQKADARTDVWSLGVVLYEMVVGEPPFAGETPSDVLVSLLKDEPAPLAEYAPDVPAELQRIVSKALRKEREERYPSMREMLDDLREARDEATFRARQELHLSGGSYVSSGTTTGGPRKLGRAAAWVVAALVAVSALSFGLYEYVRRSRAPRTPPTAKMERVTADGKISQVALSPDGKYIAYAAGPPQQQALWVMQTGARSHSQLIPPIAEVVYWGLTFSPDGDYIYYVRSGKTGPWELYRVPTLGGTPKKLVSSIDSAVTFSPDGRRLAFIRASIEGGQVTESRLLVANADGTGERVLAARRLPDFFLYEGIVKISWSPDGESIACPAGNTERAFDDSMGVVAVSVKDGSERPLAQRRWAYVAQAAWLGDASGLVLVARDQPSSPDQIWHVSYPEGSARRLTNDLSSYGDVSVTADSSAVAAVQIERLSNIWVAPEGDTARARQITDSRDEGWQGISWAPDGRLVYRSNVSGNADIWVMDADGGNRKRLTDDPGFDGWPHVSPDGRYVVFVSVRAGRQNIWRMDVDGGNPVRLTDGSGENSPYCSPDGRWVYYNSYRFGVTTGPVWKVPIDGGTPTLVSAEMAGRPALSPDRKWLAYLYSDMQANPPFGIKVVTAEGGRPVAQFQFDFSVPFRWMPDGRALAYIDERSMNVWARPLDGGGPVQLTDFKTDQTFWFDWSRDGRALALSRGRQASDVVLITDFK